MMIEKGTKRLGMEPNQAEKNAMKTVVITGATSGIGFAVCCALAQRGYRVIGVGRTQARCDDALAKIKAQTDGDGITFVFGDLSRQNDVARVADEISAYLDRHCAGRLYALINNAGGVRSWYETTPEGFELQFALNHLAGVLLTYRLMPYLIKTGGRIISTGSESHKHMKIHWQDIMYQKRYSCLMAYKQSKLCNILFAAEINRRYNETGVRAYVVDPGLVCTDIGSKQTSGIVNRFWSMRKRKGVLPNIPAETYAYLCDAQPMPKGLYYHLCNEKPHSRYADNAQEAKRLFELSEKLCGITYGEWGI